MRGRLIVVEGIDGSGKSTLVRRLHRRLASGRRRAILAREPGGTAVSEQVRRLLLDARHSGMTPMTELFLYMAARAQLVDEVVRPALSRGAVVLLDRYYHSTAAYQGAAGSVGLRTVIDLAERTARFPRPDLVLLLDLPSAVARGRGRGKRDRVERKGVAYQDRVRRGFRSIARRDPRRVRVLDATKPPGEVFEDALREIRRIAPA